MEKLMGLAIAGSVALLVLMFSVSPVASSLTDAQIDDVIYDSAETELTEGELFTSDNVDVSDAQYVEVSAEHIAGDGDVDVRLTTDGTVADDGPLMETGDTVTLSVEDPDADEAQLELEEMTGEDSATVDWTFEGEEENQFSGLMALALLIFLVSFAAGIWKAVV